MSKFLKGYSLLLLICFFASSCENNALFELNDISTNEDASVRIATVSPNTDEVVLLNFGNTSINISDYRLCSRRTYSPDLLSLSQTPGTTQILLEPGASVTLDWFLEETSDLGLYIPFDVPNPEGFSNPNYMVDFMQFGGNFVENGRESVAVSAGIWEEGTTVSGAGPFVYTSNTGLDNGFEQWDEVILSVRMVAVDPINNEVTIQNFGNEPIDISDYRMCSRFVYSPNLTSLPGSPPEIVLASGEQIIISWQMDNSSSDVSIYNAFTGTAGFEDADRMIDFMQYGDSGIGRENIAGQASLWLPGTFVQGSGPFEYTSSIGVENGVEAWQ